MGKDGKPKSKEVKEVKPKEAPKDKDYEVMKYVIGFSGESAGNKEEWLRKLDKFMSLDEKERVKRCKAFVEYLISMSKAKGKIVAGKAFINLINTPEGMIYFTYMFRPEFRASIVRAVASIVMALSKVK